MQQQQNLQNCKAIKSNKEKMSTNGQFIQFAAYFLQLMFIGDWLQPY